MEEPVEQPAAEGGAELGQRAAKKASTPLVVGGYLMALILPPVGLILGIVLLARRRGHGIAVIAIAASVIVTYLVTASQSDDGGVQLPDGALREGRELAHCIMKAPARLSLDAQFRLCEKQLRKHQTAADQPAARGIGPNN
jgi:hypothetical protein